MDANGENLCCSRFLSIVTPALIAQLPTASLSSRLGAKLGLLTLCHLEKVSDLSALLHSMQSQGGDAYVASVMKCLSVPNNVLSQLSRSAVINHRDIGSLDIDTVGLVSAFTFFLQEGIIDMISSEQLSGHNVYSKALQVVVGLCEALLSDGSLSLGPDQLCGSREGLGHALP